PGEVWPKLAHPQARLAVLGELEGTRQQLVLAAVKDVGVTGGYDRFANRCGGRLAAELLQFRLIVERIDGRRSADQEQKDDRFGRGTEIGRSGREGIERVDRARPGDVGGACA